MNKLIDYGIPLLALLCIAVIASFYGPLVLESFGDPGNPRDGATLILFSVVIYLISCVFLMTLLSPNFRGEYFDKKIRYLPLGIVLMYVAWATYMLIMLSRSTDL
jgi:hypothetical protein